MSILTDYDKIFRILQNSGAIAFGSVNIDDGVDKEILTGLRKWLAKGYQAGMDYLARHENLRRNPSLLLSDRADAGIIPPSGNSASIISLAFNYNPAQSRDRTLPRIATFAYGDDYHDVLRNILTTTAESLLEISAGNYRICIDSAPVMERYWAQRCGIGRRCDNGLIAVAGAGTRVLLAEIITDAEIPPLNYIKYPELRENSICLHCGKCRKSCPAEALQPDSGIDARRCLSYLTIEHRGQWNDEGINAMHSPAGRNTLFGCDICQNVCPLNRDCIPSEIKGFSLREEIAALTAENLLLMTNEEFSRLFKGTAIKRAKLAGMQRNAMNIHPPTDV